MDDYIYIYLISIYINDVSNVTVSLMISHSFWDCFVSPDIWNDP